MHPRYSYGSGGLPAVLIGSGAALVEVAEVLVAMSLDDDCTDLTASVEETARLDTAEVRAGASVTLETAGSVAIGRTTSVLSLDGDEVAAAVVGAARVLEDDSVWTKSVKEATEVDGEGVISVTGTSVKSGAVTDVELVKSVLADSVTVEVVGEGTTSVTGASMMLGRADSMAVALRIALSSKPEELETGMLVDSVAFAKTVDVAESVAREEVAFTMGTEVTAGTSPDEVAVAFAVNVD